MPTAPGVGAEKVEFYRPRSGDLPADAIELPRLESFLHQHLGLHLLTQEPGSETHE
ncbi:hypothetical protein GCM10022206_34820 [Streptomyces chiangmaiensis]